MEFYPGFDIFPSADPLGFQYGKGVFGPQAENRSLDSIRKNLKDPACTGPEIVYSIAMDVGNEKDKDEIIRRNLLYGAVTYARGKLGDEPVRSQGHVHAVSATCGMSTCEVYEIWSGTAYIYMQETTDDNPGRCFAVQAYPGEVVIVPPAWAHCTISGDIAQNLSFGAWCVRDYGFDYSGVRSHGGVAWFPIAEEDKIVFHKNTSYLSGQCIIKRPRQYKEFGIEKDKSIYRQFEENPDKFLFVSHPQMADWGNFIP